MIPSLLYIKPEDKKSPYASKLHKNVEWKRERVREK